MRDTKAKTFFTDGCNCCQAVVKAFAEETGMDTNALMRLSSSFGGGMGGLGEVCGAVSGMFLILGALHGYDDAAKPDEKQLHYARIRAAAERFKEKYGSIICRELKTDGKDRVFCADLVAYAARLTEDFLPEK